MSSEYKINPVQRSSFSIKKNPDPQQQENKEQNRHDSTFSTILTNVQNNNDIDNKEEESACSESLETETSPTIINVDSFLDLIKQSQSLSKIKNKF